jgi:copper chaperone
VQESFNVPEVSCGHCKDTIESALQPLEGVVGAEVDIEAKRVAVDYDDGRIDRVTLVRTIESAGYAVAG